MFWPEKIIATCDYNYEVIKCKVVNLHFDRVWLEPVAIAHAAFCLESIVCAYTELHPFLDGWVSDV